jgi:hypothetical protein
MSGQSIGGRIEGRQSIGGRQNAVWVGPGALEYSCLCERCLEGLRSRGSSFLESVRHSAVRGSLPLDTSIAFVRCRSGHELVIRRVDRPPNLAHRDARQLELV